MPRIPLLAQRLSMQDMLLSRKAARRAGPMWIDFDSGSVPVNRNAFMRTFPNLATNTYWQGGRRASPIHLVHDGISNGFDRQLNEEIEISLMHAAQEAQMFGPQNATFVVLDEALDQIDNGEGEMGAQRFVRGFDALCTMISPINGLGANVQLYEVLEALLARHALLLVRTFNMKAIYTLLDSLCHTKRNIDRAIWILFLAMSPSTREVFLEMAEDLFDLEQNYLAIRVLAILDPQSFLHQW
jgi:hypothetical protein